MTKENILPVYLGKIYNRVYPGDVCALPVDEVVRMPMNSGSLFHISNREPGRKIHTYNPIAISKYQPTMFDPSQIYLKDSIRLIPGDDQTFFMEAFTYDVRLTKMIEPDLLKPVGDNDVLIGFNVQAKKNGRYYPALRADRFIPWALEVFDRTKRVDFILADYEPGSDTYQQFMDNYHLPENPDDESVVQAKIKAMESTWGHRQNTKAGFILQPGDSIRFHFLVNSNKPPIIFALYKRNQTPKPK